MTNNYNFDEIDQSERPVIIMGGNKYYLRYPTVEEIEEVQKLKTDEEKNEFIYKFVDKEVDDQPDFRTVLRKQNIKVFRAFLNAVKKEFGVE